jgi:DNA-directed RNA polymerase specialized sigma subunit
VVDTPEPSHADADPSNEERDARGDDSLQDLSREQLDLARERLSRELGRDPTEDEIDDWLRRQTEGY